MKVKIEKNIPIPPSRGVGREKGFRDKNSKIFAVESLSIGESIFFKDYKATSLSVIAVYARRRTKSKFVVRSVEGGARIWRIE